MTEESMALKALLEKTSDADVLNEMIGFAANRLMALEADALCNAGRHERTADRLNYRNGYRDRMWETRAGTIELQIPKLRKGSYFPVFLEHRRTAEKALIAVIQEAYVQVKLANATFLPGSSTCLFCREIAPFETPTFSNTVGELIARATSTPQKTRELPAPN